MENAAPKWFDYNHTYYFEVWMNGPDKTLYRAYHENGTYLGDSPQAQPLHRPLEWWAKQGGYREIEAPPWARGWFFAEED